MKGRGDPDDVFLGPRLAGGREVPFFISSPPGGKRYGLAAHAKPDVPEPIGCAKPRET